MAKGINKVILIGNVGAEPEKGNNYAKINLAIGSNYKDKNGETIEKTEWIKVVFFGRLADIVMQYTKKGSKIYVEGAIQTSTYEKDGQTHYSTSVIASGMQMLDSRPESGSKPKFKPSSDKLSGHESAKLYLNDEDSLPF